MKRSFEVFAVSAFLLLLTMAGQAAAQWRGPQTGTPRDGACFYLDGGYSNRSFCLNAGQSMDRMPAGFNDQITSIRVFGRAQVTVYENSNFGGPNQTFDRSVGDLRNVRKADDPSRVWSDRISSVRVDSFAGNEQGYGQGRDDRWDRNRGDRDRDDYRGNARGPVWGRAPQPRAGACFFRDSNFNGDYFCMARGESFNSLPPGFNDRISSIRTYGGARVMVYQDSDFRGRTARFARDINDLHDRRTRDDQSRNWNDRISSIQVQ